MILTIAAGILIAVFVIAVLNVSLQPNEKERRRWQKQREWNS